VVFVKVFDQFGQPVEGVILLFTFRYGLEGGETMGPALEVGTGGPVGKCTIKMTPPPGYEVPASQPNPFTVTVVEKSDQRAGDTHEAIRRRGSAKSFAAPAGPRARASGRSRAACPRRAWP
jgi:hypothetical protein